MKNSVPIYSLSLLIIIINFDIQNVSKYTSVTKKKPAKSIINICFVPLCLQGNFLFQEYSRLQILSYQYFIFYVDTTSLFINTYFLSTLWILSVYSLNKSKFLLLFKIFNISPKKNSETCTFIIFHALRVFTNNKRDKKYR